MSEITVTVSDRWEEAREAFRIVHDGFVEAGYMEAQASGRRLIGSYLNPGTVFVVINVDGEPAASGVLMADGPFGLPADRAYAEEIDQLRARGIAPCEFGSLTVLSRFRDQKRAIYPLLVGSGVRLMAERPADQPLIVVEPEQARFFGTLFGVDQLGDVRPLYGAPAVLMSQQVDAIVGHLRNPPSALARRTAEQVLAEDPAWLRDVRGAGGPWPADEIGALADEQGVFARLGRQLDLLAASFPEIAAGVSPS